MDINVKCQDSTLQNVILNFTQKELNQCTNCVLFNYNINTVWHNRRGIYTITFDFVFVSWI